MKYLLSQLSRRILQQCAHEPTLCAFDFDGTLSPIVAHPSHAHMRVRTRRLLATLAALYPCVVISGRSRRDLLTRLDGVKVAGTIGNHGAETGETVTPSRNLIDQWKISMEREFAAVPGLWIEDKGLSLSVHYRQSRFKSELRRRITHAARQLQGVRVFGGKEVVNLVPAGEPNKGEALAHERNRLACVHVIYVGDDENDEDAFAMSGNIISVRIGRERKSRANYYLRTQKEIDLLLEQLISLRQSDVKTKVTSAPGPGGSVRRRVFL